MTRIDDYADQKLRCVHDMLRSQCSWCKGLPDVPNFDTFTLIDDERVKPRWIAAERRDDCAACATVIEKNEPIAFSPEHQGWIGRCCEDAL